MRLKINEDMKTSDNIRSEIRIRVTLSNRCLYGLTKHLRSKLLIRTIKLKLYNTLIVPVLIYGVRHGLSLKVIRRKILRVIYGSVNIDGE